MFTVAEIEIMCDEILMAGHGMTAQVIHALPERLIGRGPCKYAVWLPSPERVAFS